MTITLINTNRMAPPIGPIGLDYVAGAARAAGIATAVVDLNLADDAGAALAAHFADHSPQLVGLSFRNIDDCFWPGVTWFVPALAETVAAVRRLTDAPIVLGGVGFSICPERLLAAAGADFGVRGDGEAAIVALARAVGGQGRLEDVPGLLRRADGPVVANPPAWPLPLSLPTGRDAIDNAAYFRLGGQGGVETKRGCDRPCIYCADPLAKGRRARCRAPGEVADEVEALLAQGVDVLHLCDGEFNVPYDHALAVCEEFIARGVGRRVRWYAYLAVRRFDAALASAMRQAGCVGIDFTADSASAAMLATYRHQHRADDLAEARRLCAENGIAVMFDLLLGGPGETPETVAETIGFMKRIDPDAVGAALGVRVCPGTAMADRVAAEGAPEANPAIRRRYDGPVDFLKPTFYIAPALGEKPAALVCDLIGDDKRFFAPADDPRDGEDDANYNYSDNTPLVRAVADGARGAYWHILRQLRD